MKRLEWTNELNSMQDALRALNIVLVETPDLEETAKLEALNVKRRLDLGNLSRAETVDYLKQASIDLVCHKRGYQNGT